MQLFVNIVYSFSILLLLAMSFAIIYQTAKFFHLVHAAIITLAPYFTFCLYQQLNTPLLYSIPVTLVFITLLIYIIIQLLYKPLQAKNSNPLIMLLASLGLYVVIQNTISLIWGDDIKSLRIENAKVGNEFMGSYVSDIQLVTIAVSLFLVLAIILFLKKSKLGKQMRAISSNKELSNIYGVNADHIILLAFIFGSILGAIAGILIAFDVDMTPTMGFNLLLYGAVAMIIGGVGNNWGLIGGALLLSIAQNLGAYYFNSKWVDTVVYIILILFLIWKPLGFSGKELKKTKI